MDPLVKEQVIARHGKSSASEVAREFRITRNAVLGLWHRLMAKGDLPKIRMAPPPPSRSVARPKPHLGTPATVEPPPAPLIQFPPPPPPAKGEPVALLDARDGQCRWMVSRTHCCGTRVKRVGSSWCSEHHARVFTAVPAKKIAKSPDRNALPPGFRINGRVV